MKTIFLTFTLVVITLLGLSAQSKKANTIVLVHGAFVDGSAWNKVVPLLKAKGHEVIVVNLPGHGKDNTPLSSLQLQTYVDAVKKAIGDRKDVTLVGHSLAGMIISEVAEQIPGNLRNLVYVSAFVPHNGEATLQLAGQDKDSHFGKFLQVDQKTGTATFTPEGIKDVFAGQVATADYNKLIAGAKAESLTPFSQPVTLTDANFGKVDKAYLFDTNDNAISFAFQQQMVKSGNISRVYELPADHLPFLSMPELTAAVILQESK